MKLSHRHAGRNPRGLSLIELLCGMAIAVTAVGTALPSVRDLKQSQRLQGVAAQVETDVQLARSQALAHSQGVRLSVHALAGGGSCTIVHTGAAEDCQCDNAGQASCAGDAVVLGASAQAGQGAWLSTTGRSILFDGSRGTVTPTATLKVVGSDGRAIHQIINIMGRTRSCTPQGRVMGIKAC